MRLFLQNNSAWEVNVSEDNEGDVGDIAGSHVTSVVMRKCKNNSYLEMGDLIVGLDPGNSTGSF